MFSGFCSCFVCHLQFTSQRLCIIEIFHHRHGHVGQVVLSLKKKSDESTEHSDSDQLRNFGSTIIGSGWNQNKTPFILAGQAISPLVIHFSPTFDPHIKHPSKQTVGDLQKCLRCWKMLLRIDGIFIQSLGTCLLYSLPWVFVSRRHPEQMGSIVVIRLVAKRKLAGEKIQVFIGGFPSDHRRSNGEWFQDFRLRPKPLWGHGSSLHLPGSLLWWPWSKLRCSFTSVSLFGS